MSFIQCCGKMWKAKAYRLIPDNGSIYAVLKEMKWGCPQCDNYKIEIEKVGVNGETKTIVYENEKAIKMLDKLKTSIMYEFKQQDKSAVGSAFYLNYSEYGKKKKCYSNLSTLKMGLFESSYKLPVQKDLIAV